jgi:hypothetical protein
MSDLYRYEVMSISIISFGNIFRLSDIKADLIFFETAIRNIRKEFEWNHDGVGVEYTRMISRRTGYDEVRQLVPPYIYSMNHRSFSQIQADVRQGILLGKFLIGITSFMR